MSQALFQDEGLEPKVLVADEVTSALDVTIQAQVLKLLERLREETGLTILFISHDLGVVQQLCHNVVMMRQERVVETGPSARILHSPREVYTRELLAAVPRIDPEPGSARQEKKCDGGPREVIVHCPLHDPSRHLRVQASEFARARVGR